MRRFQVRFYLQAPTEDDQAVAVISKFQDEIRGMFESDVWSTISMKDFVTTGFMSGTVDRSKVPALSELHWRDPRAGDVILQGIRRRAEKAGLIVPAAEAISKSELVRLQKASRLELEQRRRQAAFSS